MSKVLITGAAGFIGFHLSRALLARGDEVVGFDSLNDYYDPTLKERRLALLNETPGFRFVKGQLEDAAAVRGLIEAGRFDTVVNLAAQAGVRYSLTNPEAYVASNLVGFFNVIDACKAYTVPHLVYASSSSVYGANEHLPFSEDDKTDTPVSLYAATKKSNELMAHSYSSMFGLPTTGFRFFTVYGPYGRPDMALFIFTKNILEGKPIQVFNHGDMQRDFTYIDDIIGGVLALMDRSAALNGTGVPSRVYNIGNSQPMQLMDFVHAIEDELGRKAIIDFQPLQPGDVKATFADTTHLREDTGYVPAVPVKEGVKRFVDWYREYYGV